MLELYPVYLLCNRRKTLTGSPDPMRANGTNKPCILNKQECSCVCSYNIREGFEPRPSDSKFYHESNSSNLFNKQVCIPVGCVPPACCPYLPACTAYGAGVCSPGVSAPGGCLLLGGVCHSPCEQNDRQM